MYVIECGNGAKVWASKIFAGRNLLRIDEHTRLLKQNFPAKTAFEADVWYEVRHKTNAHILLLPVDDSHLQRCTCTHPNVVKLLGPVACTPRVHSYGALAVLVPPVVVPLDIGIFGIGTAGVRGCGARCRATGGSCHRFDGRCHQRRGCCFLGAGGCVFFCGRGDLVVAGVGQDATGRDGGRSRDEER